jgi:hypothetical protein
MSAAICQRSYFQSTLSIILVVVFGLCPAGCAYRHGEERMRSKPGDEVTAAATSFAMPWLDQPAELWQRDFTGSDRGGQVSPPSGNLEQESIGSKTRVYGLFDRWTFSDAITAGRGKHYADITVQCTGSLELNFALTAQQWQDADIRAGYYRSVDDLIERIGQTLLADFGDRLQGQEREMFLRALKTLAWQESRWQHYLRYKDWFFIIVSGGSYNQLDDWGITQIARSSFDPEQPLNTNFFDSKGYCSISSSLYYGFMEYYFCYLEARENPENGPGLFNRIVGAYNRYCSGYSSSCFGLAADNDYRSYQIRALGGFKDRFISQPWQEAMSGVR